MSAFERAITSFIALVPVDGYAEGVPRGQARYLWVWQAVRSVAQSNRRQIFVEPKHLRPVRRREKNFALTK
jgi:hypothetical protein